MSFALSRMGVTIYVIARSVEAAEQSALDYWEDASEDRDGDHDSVYLQRDAAEKALHGRSGSYDPDRDRVYDVSVDFHVTKKYSLSPSDELEAAKLAALLREN
ncbi:hypothetical protein ABZ953_07125 [Streptomyces sp. NPDC046465]|uniref:hypothetical protein n=1 Tax=Streptomyces sp. NPDC046465 TaxID=3155810 RepID=UPI0034060025